MSIADIRREYSLQSLTENDVAADPFRQFHAWFDQALNAELLEPTAMSLATATSAGVPSVRVVLLKGADERGFVYFTDYRSSKGRDVDANPHAALCFFWDALQRQVRISGRVERVSNGESLEYFRTRPHGSKVGAWASHQSEPLQSRALLEREVAEYMTKYPEGTEVPLPHHWGGYRVVPDVVEFWQGRESRLHDRIVYSRDASGGWTLGRLWP